MHFLALGKHVIGVMLQVTECRYSIPVLRYNLLCDRVYFVPTYPIFVGPVTNGDGDLQQVIAL